MALIEASRLLLAYGIGYAARVQNGYVSPGTGGHARPPQELENGPVSSENVPASARASPYLSSPRNEGLPGSSPGVGSSGCFTGLSSTPGNAGADASGTKRVHLRPVPVPGRREGAGADENQVRARRHQNRTDVGPRSRGAFRSRA